MPLTEEELKSMLDRILRNPSKYSSAIELLSCEDLCKLSELASRLRELTDSHLDELRSYIERVKHAYMCVCIPPHYIRERYLRGRW